MQPHLTPKDIARFWSKVDRSGGPDACWPFVGHRDKLGYGKILIGRSCLLTHRVAWISTNGPIPNGLCVLHRCDNPPCCNPAHHFIGTRVDNSADMIAKGRQKPGGAGRSWNGERAGERNHNAKLTAADVLAIRAAFDRGESNRADLARLYGVGWVAIDRIVRRESWRSI